MHKLLGNAAPPRATQEQQNLPTGKQMQPLEVVTCQQLYSLQQAKGTAWDCMADSWMMHPSDLYGNHY